MPSMGAGAAGKGRPVLPFAVNPLCLDVSAPASRLEHPLLAPPRSVIPRLRGSSPGGPSSPAAPPSVAGLAPRRSVPQVFDLSALPCESPRTPRALVTPLHVRRRHPLQAPPLEEGGHFASPTVPDPPAPTPPPGQPFASAANLVPLAPTPPPDAHTLRKHGLKPEMRQIIRARAVLTPRWQTTSGGAPVLADHGLRAIGLAAL